MILPKIVPPEWSQDSSSLPTKEILKTERLSVHYRSTTVALDSVSLTISEQRVTAIIGPSGCGKSTLLRCFNRMNDFLPEAEVKGRVLFQGHDLNAPDVDPVDIRRRIGMVFQKPNPFPKSISRNVSWGPWVNGMRHDLSARVERSLRKAALWDEVKDRLNDSANSLSGGQQQRLCIARALAMEPEILLMDEPCSALDPASTAHIEDLILELVERYRYTIVIVTHNLQQAARVSNDTIFLENGHLVEAGPTHQIFHQPREKRTDDYVHGRFG